MAKRQCQCGAKYRFPESAVGRRAKCKKCGATFTLQPEEEEGTIPLADEGMDEQWSVDLGQTATRSKSELPPIPTSALPSAENMGRLAKVVIEEAPKKPRGYLNDVLRSFLFPSSLNNIVAFVVLWLVIFFARFSTPVLLFYGPLFLLIFQAWYAAFRFRVIQRAAGGNDDLPSAGMPRELIEDLIYPLLRWVGSWIVVLLPAFAYTMVGLRQGWFTSTPPTGAPGGVLPSMFQGPAAGMPVFIFLLCGGIFLWPMIILCVAMGGFSTLHRFDLMFATIIRTLPAYLCTIGLLVLAFVSEHYLSLAAVGANASSGGRSARAVPLLMFLATGISIYFEIVAMRVIGLYYHHFKDRFAWSWG